MMSPIKMLNTINAPYEVAFIQNAQINTAITTQLTMV